MSNKKQISKWEETFLTGSNRTTIEKVKHFSDYFICWGKDEGCFPEGTWWDMICLARNILASPNTKQAAPEFYKPEWANDNICGEEKPYEYIG